MKAKLYLVGGDRKASVFNLNLPVVIGRGRGATLVLPHPLVSRKHCELYEDHGRLMVRDFGSLNGTYVGSERVEKDVELPNGELLTIATVNFRAVYADAEDDTTTLSDRVYDSDSTHDSVRLSGPQEVQAASHADDEQADLDAASSPPKERDTEWQVGSLPPRADSGSGDDLNSLLNNGS